MDDGDFRAPGLRRLESVSAEDLFGSAADMSGELADKALSNDRRKPPRETHRVVGLDMKPRIMYMRHPHGRQRACAHQEMPSACIVLVVVDGVVPPLPQHLAELLRKSRKVGASVAQIMDLGAQPLRLLIEDPGIAAGGQKIDSADFAF